MPAKHKLSIAQEKPESFFEIEVKGVLSREQYDSLSQVLPARLRQINEDSITTTRYRPGDNRLRISPKVCEFVCKQGDVTNLSRREVKIPLLSREALEAMAEAFSLMKMQPDPPWLKHKKEFEYRANGHAYTVCLQNIVNYAYILEVERLSKTDDSELHGPTLKRILREFGCEPVEPADMSRRIAEYIAQNTPRK